MPAPEAISLEQTLEILNGPRRIPNEITARVEERLDSNAPLVDADTFSTAVAGLIADKGRSRTVNPAESRRATFEHIVLLGSSSLEFATQLAGDIQIPRPRRLHEHDQSAQNIHDEFFAPIFTDPRDRVLPAAHFLKDSGKAHCVALNKYGPRASKDQAVHNMRMTGNLLEVVDSAILTADDKKVAELLVEENVTGWALRNHSEKGAPLEDVLRRAMPEIKSLYDRCPDDYKDRFMLQLAASCFIDMAAHTRRARYIDAGTQRVRQDVLHRDRYKRSGEETMMTLDRLFSEAPEYQGAVLFHQPKHIAVLRGLFGEVAEQFIVQEQTP